MPTLNKSKRVKGMGLVEVVVALSILTIVFGGTVTLIVNVVNLAVTAKQKTEAITYAQKGLAEKIKQLNYGCVVTLPSTELDTNYPNYSVHTKAERGDLAGTPVVFSPNANGSFIKINSTVTWYNRFGRNDYSVNQIMRVSR